MKAKWYFGALIIALSVLGISSRNAASPNQEMVLNFADKNITSNEAQSAITLIKNQLLSLGATGIEVNELKSGKLHISYYCNTRAKTVKDFILSHTDLSIGCVQQKVPKTPKSKGEKDFKLDVFEIHKKAGPESGFDGKSILITKQDFDRFNKPYTYSFCKNFLAFNDFAPKTETFKRFKYIAISLENTLQNIQNVRAGPEC
ncbi:MAG: hypothetical protein ACK5NB_03460 [Flavobacteriaceae bacterium]